MTKRLKLDDCIVFVSRETAASSLGISLPTLREYQFCLNQLAPKGWDYQAGDRGFTRNSLEVLASFRCMVQDLGRRQAILKIRAVMESKHSA
jgi:hypothetical protein